MAARCLCSCATLVQSLVCVELSQTASPSSLPWKVFQQLSNAQVTSNSSEPGTEPTLREVLDAVDNVSVRTKILDKLRKVENVDDFESLVDQDWVDTARDENVGSLPHNINSSSAVGIFLRSFLVDFNKLSFEQTVAFFKRLRVYVAAYDAPPQENSTRHLSRMQTEFYLDECVQQLLDGTCSITPNHLQKICNKIAKRYPDLARVHYVSYLNYVRCADFLKAEENLHRFFDYAFSTSEKEQFQFALVSLADLHTRFGHLQEAHQAIKEAIRTSRRVGDHESLATALQCETRLAELQRKNGIVGAPTELSALRVPSSFNSSPITAAARVAAKCLAAEQIAEKGDLAGALKEISTLEHLYPVHIAPIAQRWVTSLTRISLRTALSSGSLMKAENLLLAQLASPPQSLNEREHDSTASLIEQSYWKASQTLNEREHDGTATLIEQMYWKASFWVQKNDLTKATSLLSRFTAGDTETEQWLQRDPLWLMEAMLLHAKILLQDNWWTALFRILNVLTWASDRHLANTYYFAIALLGRALLRMRPSYTAHDVAALIEAAMPQLRGSPSIRTRGEGLMAYAEAQIALADSQSNTVDPEEHNEQKQTRRQLVLAQTTVVDALAVYEQAKDVWGQLECLQLACRVYTLLGFTRESENALSRYAAILQQIQSS